MNTGEPPTARNARTGEFTPPAMIPRALANAEMDRSKRKRTSSIYLATYGVRPPY